MSALTLFFHSHGLVMFKEAVGNHMKYQGLRVYFNSAQAISCSAISSAHSLLWSPTDCSVCLLFLTMIYCKQGLPQLLLSSRTEADVGWTSSSPRLHWSMYEYPYICISQQGHYLWTGIQRRHCQPHRRQRLANTIIAVFLFSEILSCARCLTPSPVNPPICLGIFIPMVSSYIWIRHDTTSWIVATGPRVYLNV